jgi:hypothetical protein
MMDELLIERAHCIAQLTTAVLTVRPRSNGPHALVRHVGALPCGRPLIVGTGGIRLIGGSIHLLATRYSLYLTHRTPSNTGHGVRASGVKTCIETSDMN